jgi:hypothetical protein
MEHWNLGQFIIIDEMMVRYKGSYCPARQYMPKKPKKWGMKIWCLADSVTRFVFNFDIYCGASFESLEDPKSKKGEGRQGQRVVESLLDGLETLIEKPVRCAQLLCDCCPLQLGGDSGATARAFLHVQNDVYMTGVMMQLQ